MVINSVSGEKFRKESQERLVIGRDDMRWRHKMTRFITKIPSIRLLMQNKMLRIRGIN